MPKFYCEYCDIYLTHSSPAGRRQHTTGRKHINAKVEYFQNLLREPDFRPPDYILRMGPHALERGTSNPYIAGHIGMSEPRGRGGWRGGFAGERGGRGGAFMNVSGGPMGMGMSVPSPYHMGRGRMGMGPGQIPPMGGPRAPPMMMMPPGGRPINHFTVMRPPIPNRTLHNTPPTAPTAVSGAGGGPLRGSIGPHRPGGFVPQNGGHLDSAA